MDGDLVVLLLREGPDRDRNPQISSIDWGCLMTRRVRLRGNVASVASDISGGRIQLTYFW